MYSSVVKFCSLILEKAESISLCLNPKLLRPSIASSIFLFPVLVLLAYASLPRKSNIIWFAALGPIAGNFLRNNTSFLSIASISASGVVPPRAEIAVLGPTPLTETNLLNNCFSSKVLNPTKNCSSSLI